MKLTIALPLCALVLAPLVAPVPLRAEERPLTGDAAVEFDSLDKVVLETMDTLGANAATVAVSRDGKQLYSRGYGWSDEAKKKSTAPDTMFRIASITKPFTAAAVKSAIRNKLLDGDAKAFELLGVKPAGGKTLDPKLATITVDQLLEHQGGWDRDATFDPVFFPRRVERELRLRSSARPSHLVQFMLSQPLQFEPGEKSVYSNFGYTVLGRVLEKTYGKTYLDALHLSVCKPLGITDVKLGVTLGKRRPAREAWVPVADDLFSMELLDSCGGLTASAPALCQFLNGYWLSGEPRRDFQRGDWYFFGSLPGTTAMARQRPDGLNIALLLNARRDEHYQKDNEALKKSVDEVLHDVRKRRAS